MTLHDSLMARLDRLGASQGRSLQLGRSWGGILPSLLAMSPYDEPTLRQKIAPARGRVAGNSTGPPRSPCTCSNMPPHPGRCLPVSLEERSPGPSPADRARPEARHADDLDLHLLDIAHHLFSAGRAPMPRTWCTTARRAADHAVPLAWREAAHYYAAAVRRAKGRDASLRRSAPSSTTWRDSHRTDGRPGARSGSL